MAASTYSDDDGLARAPWYVRAFIRVGAPTAFACALLWFLMTNVTASMGAIQEMSEQMLTNQTLIISNQGKIIELLGFYTDENRANARFLSAVCVNLAETSEQRERCAEALRPSTR